MIEAGKLREPATRQDNLRWKNNSGTAAFPSATYARARARVIPVTQHPKTPRYSSQVLSPPLPERLFTG